MNPEHLSDPEENLNKEKKDWKNHLDECLNKDLKDAIRFSLDTPKPNIEDVVLDERLESFNHYTHQYLTSFHSEEINALNVEFKEIELKVLALKEKLKKDLSIFSPLEVSEIFKDLQHSTPHAVAILMQNPAFVKQVNRCFRSEAEYIDTVTNLTGVRRSIS